MINIEPITLYVEDFMGHAETLIDFTQFQSAIIIGKLDNNERKSNGTGKSTIAHAINFALFGETPVGTAIDDVIRDNCDYAKVYLDLKIDSELYRIQRKRGKKTELKLFRYVNGKFDPEDRRTDTQTKESFQKLIKINYDTFCNTVLFPQGKLSDICEAKTGLERRKLLKEPLNLAIYSKLQKIANGRLQESEKKLFLKNNSVSSLGDPSKDLKEFNDLLEKNIKDINNINYNIEQTDLLLENKRHDLKEVEKLASSDIKTITTQLSELNITKRTIKSALSTLENQHNNYICSKNKYIKDKHAKNTELDTVKSSLKALQEKEIRLEGDINKDITDLDTKEQRGIQYVAKLDIDYNKFSKILPDGAQCDSCFHEITEDYRETVTKEHAKKAKEILVELNSSKDKLKKLKDKRISLRKELQEAGQHKLNIERAKNSVTTVTNKIEEIDNYLKKIELDIESSEKLVNSKKLEFTLLEDKEKNLNEIISSSNSDEISSRTLKIKNEILELEASRKENINNLTNFSGQKGSLEEKIKTRSADKETLELLSKTIKILEKEYKIRNRVTKAFSPTGIPTFIIHTILDDLQIECNNVLQDIRPELAIQFRIENNNEDALDIIYSINGKERKYSLLSGGQKMYVSFAVKLGLSKVIQKQLGINLSLLILDETDSSLDSDGVEALINIIKKMQNKFKILLITHNSDLKRFFNNAIFVDNNGIDGARAKVVDSW